MAGTGGWFVATDSTLRYHPAGGVRRLASAAVRTGGFRMVQLNIVGWAALIAPGVLVGLVTGTLVGRRVWCVSAGAVGAWLIGVTVDTLRWRSSAVRFVVDAPFDVLDDVVRDLRTDGVPAVIEADDAAGPYGLRGWTIRSQMRHRRAVERRIDRL